MKAAAGKTGAGCWSVAGIDEAGLGPTLGPLCLGAALFRGTCEPVASLWTHLKRFVSRKPGALARRLAIDDSKRLFAGRRTLAPLELAALATLNPGRSPARSLEELLDEPGEDWSPWYHPCRDVAELPVEIEPTLVERWRERWPARLAEHGLAHVASFVRPIFETELNGFFRRGGNKAAFQLQRLAPVLRRITALAPDGDLTIVVDRLGGRFYYAEWLQAVFPMRPFRALVETDAISTYAIGDGGRTVTVSFEVDADRRHLPVALASCGAKYLRELLMARFNSFFARRKPGLRPTAGYHDDAWRWLDDAADVITAAERAELVRER